MKNKIEKIIVSTSHNDVDYDVSFYFLGDINPYSYREFKKGSKTRKILEKIEKEILKTYDR